jgi:hypothetical protein
MEAVPGGATLAAPFSSRLLDEDGTRKPTLPEASLEEDRRGCCGGGGEAAAEATAPLYTRTPAHTPS